MKNWLTKENSLGPYIHTELAEQRIVSVPVYTQRTNGYIIIIIIIISSSSSRSSSSRSSSSSSSSRPAVCGIEPRSVLRGSKWDDAGHFAVRARVAVTCQQHGVPRLPAVVWILYIYTGQISISEKITAWWTENASQMNTVIGKEIKKEGKDSPL